MKHRAGQIIKGERECSEAEYKLVSHQGRFHLLLMLTTGPLQGHQWGLSRVAVSPARALGTAPAPAAAELREQTEFCFVLLREQLPNDPMRSSSAAGDGGMEGGVDFFLLTIRWELLKAAFMDGCMEN